MIPVIDESQLTAYALGELAGAERAAVAAYLAGSAEGRQFVAEIRATANLLVDELARESFGGLTDLQHAAIEQKLDDAMRIPISGSWRARRRRNWNLAVFGMSLAASVLILCGVISVLLPFVYNRVSVAIHDQQQGEEQQPSIDRLPFRMSPSQQSNPSLAVKPHEKPAIPRVDPNIDPSIDPGVATTDTDTAIPEGTFPVPLPDSHISAAAAERDETPRLVGVQPHDNVAPKPPSIHTVRPGDHRSGPAVAVEAPKSTSEAFRPPGAKASQWMENDFVKTAIEPVSGFSAGVDTASYSNIRRFLTHDRLPPPDAVRIEEMLNYFPVHAPPASPSAGEGPLVMKVEVGACPWRPEHRLARVCLQARELPPFARPAVNLVFVVDVSDPMRAEKSKLPLLKQAMLRVLGKLEARDRISIVSYSQEAVTVLAPTGVGGIDEKRAVINAIQRLEFAGHTIGGQGIEVAYDLAIRGFIPGGVNRIILASDGNWNVGRTDRDQLAAIVRNQTHNNISLTVLGVGMNTLKDANLQQLAMAGNGSYAYIDTFDEARKVLTDQIGGALVAEARDVKVQITFNRAAAREYRLIGYERRILPKDKITSESTRGGELGAGQSVTALYEVIPAPKSAASRPADMLTATVTYVDPATLAPHSLQTSAEDRGTPVPKTSVEFRFAAAVAEFGLLLRNSDYKGNANWSSLLDHAKEAVGPDDTHYRAEFLKLVQKAKVLPPTAR
jgi:Ca-activated chloride channel family protein